MNTWFPAAIWVASASAAATAIFVYEQSAAFVTTITAFIATVITVVVESLKSRLPGIEGLIDALRLGGLILASGLLIYSFHELGFSSRRGLASPIIPLLIALLVAAAVITAWASRQRSRQLAMLSALKEMLEAVESVDKALEVGTRTVRDLLYLSPAHSIAQLVQRVIASFGVVTLYWLEPGTSPGAPMRIRFARFSRHTPDYAVQAFTWISENHHPVAFDPAAFRKMMALGAGERNPVAHYLRQSIEERRKIVSVTGYVSKTRLSQRARVSRRNVYFDWFYSNELEAAGFDAAARRWTRIRSFVAVAVPVAEGATAPVLFATSTTWWGFSLNDEHLLTMAAALLARSRGGERQAATSAGEDC